MARGTHHHRSVPFMSPEASTGLLEALLELELESIAASSEAIARLGAPDYRILVEGFRADHRRHARLLVEALESRGCRAPERGAFKVMLRQGKLLLERWGSDLGVLTAVRANECHLFEIYVSVLARAPVAEVEAVFACNVEEERRHCERLDDELTRFHQGSSLHP